MRRKLFQFLQRADKPVQFSIIVTVNTYLQYGF